MYQVMTALQYGWRRREHTAPGWRPDRRSREGAGLQRMLLLLLMMMVMLMLMLLLLPCRLSLHHMRRLPRLTPASAPSFHMNCSLQRRHNYAALPDLRGEEALPVLFLFFQLLAQPLASKTSGGTSPTCIRPVSYQP